MKDVEPEDTGITDWECPQCFYRWNKESEKSPLKVQVQLCEHCEKHPNMTNIDIIDRYLNIIGNTNTHNFLTMLKEIWKVIKEIKNEMD